MTKSLPMRRRAEALLWKARARLFGSGVARAVTGEGAGRRALLLMRVAPFCFSDLPATHQNEGQARELARALAEFGYEVDVADFDERRAVLSGSYDLVLDLHPRENPLYERHLRDGALRICYATGANPAFSNAAEQARLADLKSRRGVTLAPRRQVAPFPRGLIESFDAMFTFANRFTLRTYADFRLPPVRPLVNNGYDDVLPTDPATRDPRRFLFLASVGQVHKGLDLLLEAFASEPSLTLEICSSFAGERDFVDAYRTELYRTPNIRPRGFVDVRSDAFRELQASCGALILPSCSEAQCGSVTVAMSFGLPGIVSTACDFDHPEQVTLPDCGVETIRGVAREWAAQSRASMGRRSRQTLDLFRRRYTRADYARSIRAALRATVGAATSP